MRKLVVKKLALDSLDQDFRINSRGTTTMFLVVNHEKHTVEMRIQSGPYPHFVSVFNVLLYDKDVLKELHWAATSYKRKYPAHVLSTECKKFSHTYRLYVNDRGVSDALYNMGLCCKCVASLHISCEDTVDSIPEIFSGDLLDILAAFIDASNSEALSELLIGTTRELFTYLPFRAYKNFCHHTNTVCGLMKNVR